MSLERSEHDTLGDDDKARWERYYAAKRARVAAESAERKAKGLEIAAALAVKAETEAKADAKAPKVTKRKRKRKQTPEPVRVFPGVRILDDEGNECQGFKDRTSDKGRRTVDRDANVVRPKRTLMDREDFIKVMSLALDDKADFREVLAAYYAVESERIIRARREAKAREKARRAEKKKRLKKLRKQW